MKKVLMPFLALLLMLFATNACANVDFFSEIKPIPEEIKRQMIGATWNEDCPVGLDQLAYITLSHWGFDDRGRTGELIVNKAVAGSAVAVFRDLFEIRFPIENMKLSSYYYKNPDDPSKTNNSSGFYHRKDAQSPNKLSIHSYGLAFDINPFYNPSPVADGNVEPAGAEKYLNRELKHKGMIIEGGETFLIMTKHGWAWGGFFKHGADPMHFEKIINRNYIIDSLEYFPNNWGIDSAL